MPVTPKFLYELEKRNHQCLNLAEYKDSQSPIRILCKTCNTIFDTKYANYLSAKKTGCPQCKKNLLSVANKNKKFSDEMKNKISAAKQLNPVGSLTGVSGPDHPSYKHGQGRDREKIYNSADDYKWKNGVRNLYGRRCAVSQIAMGAKDEEGKNVSFAVHHLDAYANFPERRYDINNGVYILSSIHKEFHKIFGNKGDTTEKQWARFLQENYNLDWSKIKRIKRE